MASPRRTELLDAAYEYVLEHGLAEMSLRRVADAIGSSTGVLRFLFESKEQLVLAVLERARTDLAGATTASATSDGGSAAGLAEAAARLWLALAAPERRRVLVLWAEGDAAALRGPADPAARFARACADDWSAALRFAQPTHARSTAAGAAERTAVLALVRGCLHDLLATGELARTTRAVRAGLRSFGD